MKYLETIANNLKKAGVGVWAGFQLSILKGERFGLRTRIATEDVSLCVPMKS